MQVIRAHVDDVPEAAVLFAAYREFYGEPSEVEACRVFLTERLSREESVVLLGRDELGAVGFVQVYPTFSSTRLAPVWLLNDLFVAPRARGTGAADAMLEATAALADEAGAVAVELATAHTNVRAQAVYDRHGYVLDEVFRSYEKPLR